MHLSPDDNSLIKLTPLSPHDPCSTKRAYHILGLVAELEWLLTVLCAHLKAFVSARACTVKELLFKQ
jgi:hypothetical protein